MGPYRVSHLEAVATGVVTNKVPTAPYRGAGRPEAVFAVERALELAARALDADPHEPRPRSLVRPDEMPFAAGIRYRDGEPLVLDGGDYPQALRRAAERVDYAGVHAAAVDAGPRRGHAGRRPVGPREVCSPRCAAHDAPGGMPWHTLATSS